MDHHKTLPFLIIK